MGVGFLNHESAQVFFPSSGWGNEWVGDPDGGFGATQPGGWAYSILPYMDYHTLWEAGNKLSDVQRIFGIFADKPSARSLQRLVTTVVPLFNCPSKRRSPALPDAPNAQGPGVQRARLLVGDGLLGRPRRLSCEQRQHRGWRHVRPAAPDVAPLVFHRRSAEVAKRRFLAAERGPRRRHRRWHFERRRWWARNIRTPTRITMGRIPAITSVSTPVTTATATAIPARYSARRFRSIGRCAINLAFEPALLGSNHLEGLHMAFCDGSVHFIEYDVDGRIWYRLGGRNDDDANPSFRND